MTQRTPNSKDLRFLTEAVTRLYFCALGFRTENLYAGQHQPADDESALLDLLEEARNEWKIRRGRRYGELEQPAFLKK